MENAREKALKAIMNNPDISWKLDKVYATHDNFLQYNVQEPLVLDSNSEVSHIKEKTISEYIKEITDKYSEYLHKNNISGYPFEDFKKIANKMVKDKQELDAVLKYARDYILFTT